MASATGEEAGEAQPVAESKLVDGGADALDVSVRWQVSQTRSALHVS